MKIKEANVTFDEGLHKYHNADGKELSGVTALMKRQLFASKYAGVSDAVLERAAERGNLVHRQVEMCETFGGGENLAPEVHAYLDIKAENNYETVATELLVSDEKHVASGIDVVFVRDKTVYLCDIKTTSHLDMEYLSWQLSIYKYLFKLSNKRVKVGGLVAVWLPKEQYGKPKLVTVEEKPEQWVKDLIECDAKGEQWVNPKTLQDSETMALAVPQEMTKAIAECLAYEKKAKELKEQLRILMEENGVVKWECNEFKASLGKPSESVGFDAAKFKEENPDLFEKYNTKVTQRKGTFKVTLK